MTAWTRILAPGVASAIAAYDSSAYQAARKLLGDTVVLDIRIVEGVA